MTRLRDLDHLYQQAAHLQGADFLAAILRALQVQVEFDPTELPRLPATGAFVVVCNHPSGMLDGLVILDVLLRVRPDARAVVNALLQPLTQVLGEQFVFVEPDPADPARNTLGVRHLLRYLHNDVPLALFPAGAVAHRPIPWEPATDPAWHPTVARLVLAAGVPVVPLWLSGENSAAFSWLGLVHPLLRTARLPTELLNKQGQRVRVRIGQPIGVAELRAAGGPGAAAAEGLLPYLRARVFALGAAAAYLPECPVVLPQEAVVPETDAALLEADLAALRPGRLLIHARQWEVYVARRAEIPNVMREIGRLRELTFRRAGEGTGRSLDLDAYDDHYRHLFLYDREAHRLVGAYRLGPGRPLLREFGKRGFYLHSLFRLKKPLKPLLRQAVELGRSWVREEYQRQPLPLALLWKGLAAWLTRNPEYHYLIGPVSISNRFSTVSKALMVEYLKRHYFDDALAQHVRPRKPFRYRPLPDGVAPATLLGGGHLDSIEGLSKLIAELEPGGAGVPVLLRQYLRQNGRLIGFNLDPAFSNALDGLLVIDARHLPDRTLRLLDRT